MSDDYDDYMAQELWYQEDDQQQCEEQQVEENEEDEFIIFGIFSGFFNWLFK